jgi:hypothetical protein
MYDYSAPKETGRITRIWLHDTWVGLDTDGPNAAQVTAVEEAVEAAFTGRARRTPAPVAAP